MEQLKDLIKVLLAFINLTAGTRGAYCFIRMMGDSENAKGYVKKLINMCIFLILANTVLTLLMMIKTYYK